MATVRDLPPGSFALVMATGIISTGMLIIRRPAISLALLAIAALAYIILSALTAWRLVAYPRRFLADLSAPEKAFAFFTFVAGSDVLGMRFFRSGYSLITEVLAAIALVAWLLLTYTVPARVMVAARKPLPGTAVNGTWLIWVVGTQSLSIAATAVAASHPQVAPAMASAALWLWAVGATLYVVLISMILGRLLLAEISPDQLTPPLWVSMGATAITLLAGASIAGLPAGVDTSRFTPTVAAVSLILWCFGSWWIPLLLVLGVWRHVIRRVSLSFDQALWSMVFPLGMFAVSSEEFGRVEHLPLLTQIGSGEIWIALAVWVIVFLALLRRGLPLLRRLDVPMPAVSRVGMGRRR